MEIALLIVTSVGIFCNAFSGAVAITLRPQVIRRQLEPAMDAIGVPKTWLTFPIGICKVAGALGLATGVFFGLPLVTVVTAVALFGYWSAAAFGHLRVQHYDHHLISISLMLMISLGIVTLQVAIL